MPQIIEDALIMFGPTAMDLFAPLIVISLRTIILENVSGPAMPEHTPAENTLFIRMVLTIPLLRLSLDENYFRVNSDWTGQLPHVHIASGPGLPCCGVQRRPGQRHIGVAVPGLAV